MPVKCGCGPQSSFTLLASERGTESNSPALLKVIGLLFLLVFDYFTTFFAAPMGVAAMNDPAQQAWLNDIYDSVPETHGGYYVDTVRVRCVLVVGGNDWSP